MVVEIVGVISKGIFYFYYGIGVSSLQGLAPDIITVLEIYSLFLKRPGRENP